MAEGWGEHSKYCLKANYCDASQLRNVVSAKLYGQVSRTGSRTDSLKDLVNGGAIDSFPIALYVNGEFHGLYSLNIPKDEWLFNIKDGEGQQAVLFCDTWSRAAYLEEGLGYDVESYGYEYTYCSTEDTQWATDSFNDMIYFLQNNDGDEFVDGIGKYIDVDVAIDTMLTLYLESAADNMGKNILWVTYDGVKWAPIVYDLDMTWGLTNYGNDFSDADVVCPGNRTRKNLVFSKLYKFMYDDVKERYDELRKTVFTLGNVEKTFKDYEAAIPTAVQKMERLKWIKVPNPSFNNISQITSFAEEHFAFVDTYME